MKRGLGRQLVGLLIVTSFSVVPLTAEALTPSFQELRLVMSDAADINAQERSRLASAVQRYLREHKGWTEDHFRIEIRSIDPGGANVVVWGIFLDDERHPVPGGGQSVELHVDRRTGEVKTELGFQ
jgi:hypothetical protein